MRRRLSLVMTLTAWLLATGSHWDLVQTFAWGRMIATYSQSMPLAEAIRLTFTTENLCGVCEAVQDAKQQDPAVPGPGKQDLKVQLAYQPVPFVIARAPEDGIWREQDREWTGAARPEPPTPPPRTA